MKNRQKSLAFYLAGIALAAILLWLDPVDQAAGGESFERAGGY